MKELNTPPIVPFKKQVYLDYILDDDYGCNYVDCIAKAYGISGEMLLHILAKEGLIYFNYQENKWYIIKKRETRGFMTKDPFGDDALSKRFELKIYEIMKSYGINSIYEEDE